MTVCIYIYIYIYIYMYDPVERNPCSFQIETNNVEFGCSDKGPVVRSDFRASGGTNFGGVDRGAVPGNVEPLREPRRRESL